MVLKNPFFKIQLRLQRGVRWSLNPNPNQIVQNGEEQEIQVPVLDILILPQVYVTPGECGDFLRMVYHIMSTNLSQIK